MANDINKARYYNTRNNKRFERKDTIGDGFGSCMGKSLVFSDIDYSVNFLKV